MNSGSTYKWTFSSAGTANPGSTGGSETSGQSRLDVVGNLTFTPGTIDVTVIGGGSSGFVNTNSYSWRVASATGAVAIGAPTFTTTGLNTGGGSFTLSSGAGAVYVTFSPVPEPAHVLLACGAAFGGVQWFRRRYARLTALGRAR